MKYRYIYKGPVMGMDHLLTSNWRGETVAESEKKARVNLSWQFKKENNMMPGMKISLPGKLKEVEVLM